MSTIRYGSSVEPVSTDGRDIDPALGELVGEASHQKSSGSVDEHIQEQARLWTQLSHPQVEDPSYYDRPLLNRPVWKWSIPTYYYVGGLSGAALALGAAVQVRQSGEFAGLIKRTHWIGFTGCCISGALLTHDLGRPGRFLNMLRVFRPTSPMNVGAWILTATSGAAFGALLLQARAGLWGVLGEVSGYGAGILGSGLASYTGVLVANTAIPVWQSSRHTLPILFPASGMTSVGAFFKLFAQTRAEYRVTHAFGVIGAAAELIAAAAMEKQASKVPRVGQPLKHGPSGLMWRMAAVFTASSLVLSLLPGSSRRKRVASGILGTLGSLTMRFAVEHAGEASARDARASFHHQRSGPYQSRT